MPAERCGSCMYTLKLLARNAKIDEQIYLSTAGKGLTWGYPSPITSPTWRYPTPVTGPAGGA